VSESFLDTARRIRAMRFGSMIVGSVGVFRLYLAFVAIRQYADRLTVPFLEAARRIVALSGNRIDPQGVYSGQDLIGRVEASKSLGNAQQGAWYLVLGTMMLLLARSMQRQAPQGVQQARSKSPTRLI
jgi:hypothetical protein